MSTTNEQAAKRAAKTKRREQKAEVYDPYFPAKRAPQKRDPAATFAPYFPSRHQA